MCEKNSLKIIVIVSMLSALYMPASVQSAQDPDGHFARNAVYFEAAC